MSLDSPKPEPALPLLETTLVHLYRGELTRSDTWRNRLDTTTNWALTTTAVVLSYGLGQPSSPHLTFLVGMGLVLTFLFLEARRYRYYDLWIRRVRLLESGYWAALLRHEPVNPDALRALAADLTRPQLRLTLAAAVGTRLHRAYGAILVALAATWYVKLYTRPRAPRSGEEYMARAHVGPIPGEVFVLAVALLLVAMALTYGLSLRSRLPAGEVSPARRVGGSAPLWQRFSQPYALSDPRRPRKPSAEPDSGASTGEQAEPLPPS